MSRDGRPTILVLLGVFMPGVEATGPNQSLIATARALSDRYRFRAIGLAAPGEETGHWAPLEGIERLALPLRQQRVPGLGAAIRSTPHDVVMTNGFFDHTLTIPTVLRRRLGRLPDRPLMIAPRGEFSPEALALNAPRKRAYLSMARRLGLFRGVAIQATNDLEAQRARAALGPAPRIFVTPNIRQLPPLPPHRPRQAGEPLRIAFVGRISPMKNLDYALSRLGEAGVAARFDVYGPPDDPAYSAACRRQAEALPGHIQVRWHGAIPNSEIVDALAGQDMLLLPTRGENFGHAIVEALAAGTPVLISDETPWRGLPAVGAGWDLPLSQPEAFVAALRVAAARTPDEASQARSSARAHIASRLGTGQATAAMSRCLDALLGENASAGISPAPAAIGSADDQR
jgi:glycosyltransferase involved in cell wall biosynthesis